MNPHTLLYRNIKFAILILFTFLLNSFEIHSQTIAGGEIYYKLIGNRSYEIEADIYRVCNTASLNGINGYVISDSIRIPIQFTRVLITKINDTCGNPCNVSNTASNYGFERHKFKALVDFNSNPYDTFIKMGKCLINFAILENKRDPNVNTHSSGNFYLDAGINICDTLIKQNASPRFTLDPKFKGYIGDAIRYSPGPADTTEYDSLAFNLAPIQYDYNKNLNYVSQYSPTIPFFPWCPPNPGVFKCKLQPNLNTPTGFYFDSIGCQIVFSPSTENLGYVKFKVKEFRKINSQWHYIGYTSREMLFKSIYGTQTFSNSPFITSTPNGPIIPICSGNSILDIKTTDYPDYPKYIFDTTYLKWNATYRNGQLTLYDTLLEKSARIELPFNNSLINKHQYFTVSTYDKLCNEKLVSKTYIGINKNKISYTRSINIDSCNIFTYKIRPQDTTLEYSSEVSIFNRHKVLVDKFDKNRSYAVLIDSGLYYIQIKMTITGMNCPVYNIDTIHLEKQIPRIEFSYPRDTTVCSSYPANFSISASNLPGLTSYKWFKNDSISLTDSSSFNTIIHANSKIVLRMYFNDGCFSEYRSNYQSIKYTENILANTYGGDICPLDSFSISSFPLDAIKYKKPYTYNWTIYGTQWSTKKSPFKFQVKSEDKIKLRLIDDNHCILEDSAIFYPKDYVFFTLKSNKTMDCIDSTVKFIADRGGNFTYPKSILWITNESDTVQNQIFNRSITLKQNTKLKVTMTGFSGCKYTDSISVNAIPYPKIDLLGPNEICSYDSAHFEIKLDSFSGLQRIEWVLNSLIIDSNLNTKWILQDSNYVLKSIVIRENLCASEVQKSIHVFPKPVFNILGDTFYHYSNFIKLKTDKLFEKYLWSDSFTNQNNEFWATDLGQAGQYKIWCKVTDSNTCVGVDTITIYTNQYTGVNNGLKNQLKIFPNPTSGNLYIISNITSEYSIIDVSGRLVTMGQILEGVNSIDLCSFSNGIYFLNISGEFAKIEISD